MKNSNNKYTVVIIFLWACILLIVTTGTALALDPDELSIEQLMEMEVATPSKTEQPFSDTASALYVITNTDIRRSGVTAIPDALRLVPGINVAQITSSKWAVSARGFNGRFASKLLVLIDGRTVYTPDFNGVYWETQDLLLEDIDRIEVIRGPGASIWGSNAVNGVINIITKHAENTQGAMITALAGDEDRGIAGFRYGDSLGDRTHYRLYAKYLNRDGFADADGGNAQDKWAVGRGGFRLDWNSQAGTDQLMMQGDIYSGDIDQNFVVPSLTDPSGLSRSLTTGDVGGGSLMMNWTHDISLSSRLSAQLYYDHYYRKDSFQNTKRDTFDIELRHEIALSNVNQLIWGAGYRLTRDEGKESDIAFIRPADAKKDLNLFSLFFQDKQLYFDDTVELSFGTRIQHFTFSGWQFEPSVKALWKFHPNHRIWGSVSRATRAPSRGERDVVFKPLRILPSLPVALVITGNPDFERETVISYELGYRFWPFENFSFDMAAFYNVYDDLISLAPDQVNLATLEIPLIIENGEKATTWGIEISTDWRPFEATRLQFSYSYLRSQFTSTNAGDGLAIGLGDNRNPRHQASLRLSQDLTESLELDLWLRYVDSIDELNSSVPGIVQQVDGYLGFDARIAWTPVTDLELSLVGRNLIESEHIEFFEEIGTFPTQVERSFYGQIRYSF